MENTPMEVFASLSCDGFFGVVPTIPAEVYAHPEPQASLYGESFPRAVGPHNVGALAYSIADARDALRCPAADR